MRLFIIIILVGTQLLARSQHEELSKLEVLRGTSPEEESPSGFVSFGAETDLGLDERDKYHLRFFGQVSDLHEEDFIILSALPGRKFSFTKELLFEVEGGPGLFVIQRLMPADPLKEVEEFMARPTLAPALQLFSRLSYSHVFYGEGYFIHIMHEDGYIRHVKGEIGYHKKRINPFLSCDTLYVAALGLRYEFGKKNLHIKPGMGLACSEFGLGGIFSVTGTF